MIEEATLKKALLSVVEHQVHQFPEPSEQDRRIARRLRPKIKRLIEKKESPFTYYAKQIAILFALLLGIMGAILFGSNDSVRAGVIRWLQEHFEHNVYRYRNHSGEDLDLTKYSLQEKVPQGYQFFDCIVNDDGINEIYLNDSGDLLSFTVMSPAYDGEVYLVSEKEKISVHVGRFQADIYLSNDLSEGNEIVWQNETGALFIIQGFLSEEELIELAEQIR